MSKTMIRWAKVTCRFEGMHRYPDAPAEVSFLKHLHRHIFHITVFVEQFHNERDVEYIMLKRWLETFVDVAPWPEEMSCEAIAERVGTEVCAKHPGRRVMVEVNEDGENGALVEFEP